MKIYLVRHGQSTANLELIAGGGGTDTPLTDLGIDQARRAKKALEHKDIRAVYSSSLLRAERTADIIHEAYQDATRTIDDRIKEQHLGNFEGRDLNIRGDWHPGVPDYAWTPPGKGGEAMGVVSKRVRSFYNQIVREHHGENIVLVTHSVPIILLGLITDQRPLKDYDYNTYGVVTASISVIQPHNKENPRRLWGYNGHLS